MATLSQGSPRQQNGSYDAARDSDEFRRHWANADHYDADSANSREVRRTLVSRSRYEIGNNGYSDGIAQTYSTDTVGSGPVLRMQTSSPAFNARVEFQWKQWCKAVQLRRKLWCLAHAKHQDGEALSRMGINPAIRHRVQLDIRTIETEQCQSPYAFPQDSGRQTDGIILDEWGNPAFYEFLKHHPGSVSIAGFSVETDRVPAEYVTHWYKLRRPGQHRGVPECASTLNVGAAARRFREATIAAAETAADHAAIIHTNSVPEGEAEPIQPMTAVEIEKRMMMSLPAGWQVSQMKAESPNATYDTFNNSLIREQGRSKNMPFNKAAADSSSYNYASGRLDHQTYYGSLDADRLDCNDLVLEPIFSVWFKLAVLEFGWFAGIPVSDLQVPPHEWDWPKHPVADVQTEATANDINLKNGSLSLPRLYSQNGQDFEDELPAIAASIGVTIDQARELLRNVLFNSGNQQASMLTAQTQAKTAGAAESAPETEPQTEAEPDA